MIRTQLLSPRDWRQDEDGAPVPTFSTSRVDITDWSVRHDHAHARAATFAQAVSAAVTDR